MGQPQVDNTSIPTHSGCGGTRCWRDICLGADVMAVQTTITIIGSARGWARQSAVTNTKGTPAVRWDQTTPAYTEEQEQAILDQYRDLLDDIDENPRFVHCPRCPEDGHDTHCPLCFGTAVLGP